MLVSDAKRLVALRREVEDLEQQIDVTMPESKLAQCIVSIPGFGSISSAELAGEIGTIERFEDEAALAVYLGMAPLTNSSGTYHGTKRPRQVNRHAKLAMMVGSAHHAKEVEQSRRYYAKKREQGKKHIQAVRCVGRQLVRVIWSLVHKGRFYKTGAEEADTADNIA